MRLLARLAARESVTRMSANNLAIVMAPNVLYPQQQSYSTTLELPGAVGVITALVDAAGASAAGEAQ